MTTPEQSAEAIYNILVGALSEDSNIRTKAEEALRKAEEEQDFFASLAQIATATDNAVQPNVRWLAAVCAKNAVKRSWRRHTRPNAVTDDERDYVISVLLDALGETHSHIAIQLSVCIASIARLDFPKQRPTIIADIRERVTTNDSFVLKHALVTLDMTLKQLASRRLISDRAALHREGPATFAMLHALFFKKLEELPSASVHADPLQQDIVFETVVYCMKSLRRVMCYACHDLSVLPNIEQVFLKIAHNPDLFMRGAVGGNKLQCRLSHLAAKIVRRSHELHPIPFQPYLGGFLQLYYNVIISFDGQVSNDDTVFHAVAFLRNAFQCADYGINSVTVSEFNQRQKAGLGMPTGVSAHGCRIVVFQFFNEQRTDALIDALISKIFILTEGELEQWKSDPEALVRYEEAAEWGKENLRRECEHLFTRLLIRDKERVTPLIVKLVLSIPKDKPLLLDACYRAIGRAAYDIRGSFDFDSWLRSSLIAILQAACGYDLGECIIQARTVWLVSQFVEQITRESRVMVYPLLVRLMSSTEYDRVIALTAAKAIQQLVDDLGFFGEDFAPHLQTCVVSCFKLIACSEEFETKRDLLTTVTNLVKICEPNIVSQVVEVIVTSVPRLWDEVSGSASGTFLPMQSKTNDPDSSGEELLRTGIVLLLTATIRRTGDQALQSDVMRKIILTILEFSIDTGKGKGGLTMLDDGCDLWLAVVDASGEYNGELRHLFPYVEKILGNDLDNISEMFKLIQSYALLGGESFMREFAPNVMAVLCNAMQNARDRGCLAAAEVVDIFLKAFSDDGVRASNVILRLVADKLIENSESSTVLAAYVGLIARTAIIDVSSLEAIVFRGNESVCVEILDRIIELLDMMYRLPRRRIGVLALCGLAGRYCMSEEVRKRLPGVLNCVVQVLSEEKKLTLKQESKPNAADFENAIARDGEKATEIKSDSANNAFLKGHERQKLVFDHDIEKNLRVEDVCRNLLLKLKNFNEDAYNKVLQATDGTVLQQLHSLLQK